MKNLPTLVLRKAMPTDLPAILELFVHTIQSTCQKHYTPKEIIAWTASAKDLPKWQARVERQYFLLAEVGGALAGFASLEGDYLDCMYTHPDFQGKGVAVALLQNIEQKAIDQGFEELLSDVSHTARPFFESKGFTVIRKNNNKIRGQVLVNFRVGKTLGEKR